MQADIRFTHKSQATMLVYFEMYPTIWKIQGVTARKQALFKWSRTVPLSTKNILENKGVMNLIQHINNIIRYFDIAYNIVKLCCMTEIM